MRPYFVIFILGAAIIGIFGFIQNTTAAQSQGLEIQDRIRQRIETGMVTVKNKKLFYMTNEVFLFYERRAYFPAWIHKDKISSQAKKLVKAIRNSDHEGLRPDDYHLESILALMLEIQLSRDGTEVSDIDQLVELEFLLTDAFLIYGSHLIFGRIDPIQIDPNWFIRQSGVDMAQVLQEALATKRVKEALTALLPMHDEYARLREKLAVYRKIAKSGGWPTVPLKNKDLKGESRAILDKRLAIEGFMQSAKSNKQFIFDNVLDRALAIYQFRNGLEPDGKLGPRTLQSLNVSADDRVKQIVVNMERWRWLPRDLQDRHILVNIANFQMEVFDQKDSFLNMRVVVGKTYRMTPVFSDRMTYLVINPYWFVPESIAQTDVLNNVKEDPNYLANQEIRVINGWENDSRMPATKGIDWNSVSSSNWSYRFIQDPGPRNLLGRVKFMFPNQFDVYLHDTPHKDTFTNARRDYSSGCIRVEKPLELTEYLLRGHPDWPPTRIRHMLSGGDYSTHTVMLPEPIAIHIVYWTAWIGNDKNLYFSPDIYGRDKALFAEMQAPLTSF